MNNLEHLFTNLGITPSEAKTMTDQQLKEVYQRKMYEIDEQKHGDRDALYPIVEAYYSLREQDTRNKLADAVIATRRKEEEKSPLRMGEVQSSDSMKPWRMSDEWKKQRETIEINGQPEFIDVDQHLRYLSGQGNQPQQPTASEVNPQPVVDPQSQQNQGNTPQSSQATANSPQSPSPAPTVTPSSASTPQGQNPTGTIDLDELANKVVERINAQMAEKTEEKEKAAEKINTQDDEQTEKFENEGKELEKKVRRKRRKVVALTIFMAVVGLYSCGQHKLNQVRQEFENDNYERNKAEEDYFSRHSSGDADTDMDTGNELYPELEPTYDDIPDYAWEIYRQVPFDASMDTMQELADNYNVDISSLEMCNDAAMMAQDGVAYIPYQVDEAVLQNSLEEVSLESGETIQEFAARTETSAISLQELNPGDIQNGQCLSDSLLVPNYDTLANGMTNTAGKSK